MQAINQISNLWRLTLAICAAVCVFAFATPPVSAQCDPVWQPFDPSTASLQGVVGVRATKIWDPDGSGPQTPKLVMGGSFFIAGNVPASNIATYDLTTGEWSSLGTGFSSGVFALAVLPNGDLVAGGEFTTAGGVSANRIARWDGSSWSPLGSGMIGALFTHVSAMAVLPNGDLIAAGDFTTAGGVSANRIARWNGSTWSPLGTGLSEGANPIVHALAVLPNGDLVAGGSFSTAGAISTVGNIARWNGSEWSRFGSGVTGSVYDLNVLPNGNLVAAGSFTTAGGTNANRVAQWNGTIWLPVGTGMNGDVAALTVLPNGDLVAAGAFTRAGGVNANGIARWIGTGWSPLGSGVSGTVRNLIVLPNGQLLANGTFQTAGGVFVNGMARWNGNAWSQFVASGMTGPNPYVYAFATSPNGDLITAGSFKYAGGVLANRIARWNGRVWSPIGGGVDGGSSPTVYSLGILPDGNPVAGGSFTNAEGTSVSNIARWNGSMWLPLGSGIGAISYPRVGTQTVLPNGDLLAGGYFSTAGGVNATNIARWNGTNWSPLGTGMTYAPGNGTASVNDLLMLANGDLIVAGGFSHAGGVPANSIARWNGAEWSSLGSGLGGGVSAVVELPNGDLVAGGTFNTAGGVAASRIARWNGSTWTSLGSGLNNPFSSASVSALAVLPNGDLVAAGDFDRSGGTSTNGIARWNGSVWSPLGSGLTQQYGYGRVFALIVLPNGDLVAGGDFLLAGGVVAPYIARWATPIPPTITGQPQSRTILTGQPVALAASPAAGSAAVSIQWKRNGINITNGPGGASPGGGTVFGASGSMGSITNGTPATLYISNFQPSDAGSYTATFSNSCGSITSLPATITITPSPCAADFNADTVLDFFDYLDFVSAFAANQPAADFNADTVIDFFDYLDFVAEFANGC